MLEIKSEKYWQEGIELISGCTPCSPGCDHCWAAARTHRFKRQQYFTYNNGQFNGDIMIHPERLKRFNTRKPKVFAIWNDLFHDGVPTEFINESWNAMFNHNKNTYLVLTKRPARMEKWLRLVVAVRCWPHNEICPDHIYLGLSICNQQEADEKIPIFLQIPGKKFLSIEPCISPIDLRFCQWCGAFPVTHNHDCYDDCQPIDAVILGGETGPGARPLHHDWVRSVRDQCASAGVSFYFKSWGKHLPEFKECFGNEVVSLYSALAIDAKRLLDGRTHDELPWGKNNA